METNISNNGTVDYESMTTIRLFKEYTIEGEKTTIEEIIPYPHPIFAPGVDWKFVLLAAAAVAYSNLTMKDKTVIKGYFGVVSETTIKFNEDDECLESETKNADTLYVSLKQVEDFIKETEEVENETIAVNTDKEYMNNNTIDPNENNLRMTKEHMLKVVSDFIEISDSLTITKDGDKYRVTAESDDGLLEIHYND